MTASLARVALSVDRLQPLRLSRGGTVLDRTPSGSLGLRLSPACLSVAADPARMCAVAPTRVGRNRAGLPGERGCWRGGVAPPPQADAGVAALARTPL